MLFHLQSLSDKSERTFIWITPCKRSSARGKMDASQIVIKINPYGVDKVEWSENAICDEKPVRLRQKLRMYFFLFIFCY